MNFLSSLRGKQCDLAAGYSAPGIHYRRDKFLVLFLLTLLLLFSLFTLTGCNATMPSSRKPASVRDTAITPHSSPSLLSKEQINPGKDPVLKNPIDGAEMLLVPGGKFVMGGGEDQPPRIIELDAFYIYKFEITNRQFRKFIDATGYKPEGNWEKWTNEATSNYPVVMVSWNDAAAYCKWAGVALPTEAQWEKAARGDDGRIYPWGKEWNPDYCNNKLTPLSVRKDKTRMLFEKTGVLPVGFFPNDTSLYGAMDMAGNVSEWTADWFSDDEAQNEGERNPNGPKAGSDKVLKGGSFYKDVESCRLDFRDDNEPSANDTDYGFRCVWAPGMKFPEAAGKTKGEAVDPNVIQRPNGVEASISSAKEEQGDKGSKPIPHSAQKDKLKKNPVDGATLILIPAGDFKMGARPDDPDALPEEKPERTVFLDLYYISRNEITYRQFDAFVNATGYKAEGPWRSHLKPELLDHPVVYVTWEDARAYCHWVGGDLPTEAQWEKAARGKEGNLYSWGNAWNRDFANVLETKDPQKLKLRRIYYDNLGTTPVGAFEKDVSPYGLEDVTGNVIEWCRDWYDPGYYKKAPSRNPTGAQTGAQKVMRGGGWGQDRRICRSTYRDRERPADVDGDFGFRYVVEIKGNSPPKAEKKQKKIITNLKDGAQMILIPSGSFVMGADKGDKNAKENEMPGRKVHLDAYYIYRNEVTNGMFRKFLKKTGYKPLGRWADFDKPELTNYPAVHVTHTDAEAYCKWAGVNLPTEAQWEKAARGDNGWLYPWGNKWSADFCNNKDFRDPALVKKMARFIDRRGTLPVGSLQRDRSPYGVMDLAGNINEWCRDWYSQDYYETAPDMNPMGPLTGTERVLKGGSWSLPPARCRASSRWSGDVESSLDDYGFRCAAPAGFAPEGSLK